MTGSKKPWWPEGKRGRALLSRILVVASSALPPQSLRTSCTSSAEAPVMPWIISMTCLDSELLWSGLSSLSRASLSAPFRRGRDDMVKPTCWMGLRSQISYATLLNCQTTLLSRPRRPLIQTPTRYYLYPGTSCRFPRFTPLCETWRSFLYARHAWLCCPFIHDVNSRRDCFPDYRRAVPCASQLFWSLCEKPWPV